MLSCQGKVLNLVTGSMLWVGYTTRHTAGTGNGVREAGGKVTWPTNNNNE